MSHNEAMPTVSDSEIYERMVSAILDHKLPPGTKLVEDKLASAFGVSRTRIRPVLVRLANEQVVTLTPNRGASVAQPTVQEAREVFEVRRLIEPTLVERFITTAQPADITRLADCIADEENARLAGDMRRAIRQAGDFHLHIAQAAGHDTLGRILRELISRTSLVLMTFSADHASEREEATACGCREHCMLLDAIRLGDAREASRLMRKHLDLLESRLQFQRTADESLDLVTVLMG
ncbi:GntR family transcriptional regulator [Pseudorhodoferax sp. Leaf267]|uniref:GntR family transcriptional regulator n=1 Tax=Pseudorhodoferax sp. Leaf267 TaxID=1736316 RepID=UPI0006FBD3F9|nr:GntR family transcriptional regulator [Pseudorhodoferax sp. Leaf267]KQP12000.1 GntR family transcriptional regulator [Pseudorhodoferax sp. Leaf267]